jgi:transposase-like protein
VAGGYGRPHPSHAGQLSAQIDVANRSTSRSGGVDHVTVYRWVQRFTPLLADAARFCRHAPEDRWFVDETYVKVNGVWRYVHRAVDQYGQVIDVLVSARRDADAARRFFRRALSALKVTPGEVITDAAAVYPGVLDELIRRPGITSSSTPTIRSRLITAN